MLFSRQKSNQLTQKTYLLALTQKTKKKSYVWDFPVIKRGIFFYPKQIQSIIKHKLNYYYYNI